MAQIETPLAQLHDVHVRLHWPEQHITGHLSVEIGVLEAPSLGQRFEQLHWQCPLRQHQGWQCEGEVRSGDQPPLRLLLELSRALALTRVQLSAGASGIELGRQAATPDITSIDLTEVPLAWLQSWLETLWPQARLGAGQLDGTVQVLSTAEAPVQVEAGLTLQQAALETDNAQIAAADIGLQADMTVILAEGGPQIDARGHLQGGEVLIGNAYLALPQTPVNWQIKAHNAGAGGWQLPQIIWRDGDDLEVEAALGLSAAAQTDHLRLHVKSADITHWPERYLSGWLGLWGWSGLRMHGALDIQLTATDAGLDTLDIRFDGVHLHAADGRFALGGVDGFLQHTLAGQGHGALSWQSGAIGEVAFGPAHWPLQSRDGLLQLSTPVDVDVLNGKARLSSLRLRLPHEKRGLELDFGLSLNALDLAPLSTALGWPAFAGQLTGVIPAARYAGGWLNLEGGLSMAIFDGRIDVTSLIMERPFGVAPTVSVDLTLMNLDLMTMTEVFDFGSISGRLDGQITNLRLVDWSPTSFLAEFHTVPGRGVRQRISQRAVQDISSVGGGGIMHSLQGRLIGLFDDFGYQRIGLGCRLLNEVCTLTGLFPAGDGFMIVEGAGLPRLNVVGFNHEVDWPTLLERLGQIADGAAPVVQ